MKKDTAQFNRIVIDSGSSTVEIIYENNLLGEQFYNVAFIKDRDTQCLVQEQRVQTASAAISWLAHLIEMSDAQLIALTRAVNKMALDVDRLGFKLKEESVLN